MGVGVGGGRVLVLVLVGGLPSDQGCTATFVRLTEEMTEPASVDWQLAVWSDRFQSAPESLSRSRARQTET